MTSQLSTVLRRQVAEAIAERMNRAPWTEDDLAKAALAAVARFELTRLAEEQGEYA
jgi:hypothetical protein